MEYWLFIGLVVLSLFLMLSAWNREGMQAETAPIGALGFMKQYARHSLVIGLVGLAVLLGMNSLS